MTATLEDHKLALERAREALDSAETAASDLDVLREQAETSVKDNVKALQAAIDRADAAERLVEELRTRVRELEDLLNPKPPFVLGACPAKPNVGFNAKAAQGVVDRFGDGAGVRLFGGSIATPSPRPDKAGAVTGTWDFDDSITTLPTVPQLVKAGAALKPNDRWGRNHEADAKVRGKKYTLAQAETALVDFAGKAKEARPDLVTTIVFTGWLFSPNKTAPGLDARNLWGPASSHYDAVGVDFDGVHGFPYADYRKHIPNVLAFLDKFGIEWFHVPELGFPRNAANDPTGAKRLELLGLIVEALVATGRCLGADAYLYESTVGNDFNALETAGFRALRDG